MKQIILDQTSNLREDWMDRFIPEKLVKSKEVLVISGIRRCGKSTLLQQIRIKQDEKDYYLNFDDERLIKFSVENFQELYEVFLELYGEQHTFYFDEIQNITGWERFVRRLYDSGNKVFITGSNASMLSKELGSHLTGRFCQYELFPFSFGEFLKFKNREFSYNDFFKTTTKVEIEKYFELYLAQGGFPQFIVEKNEAYLKSLYESILYRDVMVRNQLTNEREILELVYYLASNVAKPFSYNKLTPMIGLKHSATTKSYIEFIENTYLIFQLSKYDVSVKKQMLNAKKVYFIDNAISHKLGFNITENKGRLLENLVFITLRRSFEDLYYHLGKNECDFVVRKDNKIINVYQVCYQLNDDNNSREMKGLIEAMDTYDLKKGYILTNSFEDKVTIDDKEIIILPVWKWILNEFYIQS